MSSRKESILVIGAFLAIPIGISLVVVKLGAFITCLIAVVVPLLAILVYRYPLFLVYIYLIATPFDQFSLVGGSLSLSLADLTAIALAGVCLLRPLTLLTPPSWYLACTVGLLFAMGSSALISGSHSSLIALRGIAGKIVAAYIVTAFVIESGEIWKAILVSCIGILASVGLGVVQEIVYMREGWLALLMWVPTDSVIAPSRIFPHLIPLRVPGGSGHPGFLGMFISFPLGLAVGRVLTQNGKSIVTAILMTGGIIGFFITEARSVILGVVCAAIVLLVRQALEHRSTFKAAYLVIISFFLITISFFLLKFGGGERINVLMEVFELGPKLLFGLGPIMFDQSNTFQINVHSTPLQLLTDTGFLGFVSYLILIAMCAVGLWRHGKEEPLLFWLLGGVVGSILPGLLVHPMVGSRFHWVILALAVAALQVSHLKRKAAQFLHSRPDTVPGYRGYVSL